MKTFWLTLSLSLAGLTVPAWANPPREREDAPAVVTLEFRNYKITVSAGPNGSLYTVENRDGQRVAEKLTARELQAQLPEVHRFVKEAFAGDRKAFLDATNHSSTN